MSDASKETGIPMLASIEIEPGEISFDPAVNEYTFNLEEGTDRILVRAKTQDSGASYTVSDTNLTEGRNDIVITVTGTDGMQNVYYLHVIVGEETAIETTQQILSSQPEITQASLSFADHMMTGRNRYITLGIFGCAAFAFLLWIAFAIKKMAVKREKRRQAEERQRIRAEREKRFEIARMQQEELLRQIDELKKKSQTAGETASGLRIIHLDDEYGKSEDDYDDYYDDSDDYDYDEEESDDN